MAYVCDICGKRTHKGRSKSHGRGVAGRRWKKRAQSTIRDFKPNLQRTTLVLANGKKEKKRSCTKCIKAIKKFGKVKTYKNVSIL